MAKNDYDHRGWGHGTVGLSISTPTPGKFNFYQCSPQNANNVSQVTTSVGFEVGYKTGSLNFSKSQTLNLSDWKVTLMSTIPISEWRYEMSNPFDGSSTDFPDGAIKYNAGKARHEIKSWPDLTTTVFNWETMSVWRTDSVLTGTVNVHLDIDYQPDFMFLRNTWPAYCASYWGKYTNTTCATGFAINMSVVS